MELYFPHHREAVAASLMDESRKLVNEAGELWDECKGYFMDAEGDIVNVPLDLERVLAELFDVMQCSVEIMRMFPRSSILDANAKHLDKLNGRGVTIGDERTAIEVDA